MSLDDITSKDYQNNEGNMPARSRFSAEEDAKLVELQQQQLNWSEISRQIGNRSPRQCRERFQNYLDPELNKSNWTQDEDNLLLKKESEMGKKWKKMMPYFQNRSNVNIKNRFTTLQNRKKANERLIKQNEVNTEQLTHGNLKRMHMMNFHPSSQQLQLFQQVQTMNQIQQNDSQNMLNDQYQTQQPLSQMYMPISGTSQPSYDQISSFYPSYSQNSMGLLQQRQQMNQLQQQQEEQIKQQQQKEQIKQQLQEQQIQLDKQAKQIEELEKLRLQMIQQQKQSEQIEQLKNTQQSQPENQIQQMDQTKQNQKQLPPNAINPNDKNNDKIVDKVFDDQEIQMMWNFLDSDIGEKYTFF